MQLLSPEIFHWRLAVVFECSGLLNWLLHWRRREGRQGMSQLSECLHWLIDFAAPQVSPLTSLGQDNLSPLTPLSHLYSVLTFTFHWDLLLPLAAGEALTTEAGEYWPRCWCGRSVYMGLTDWLDVSGGTLCSVRADTDWWPAQPVESALVVVLQLTTIPSYVPHTLRPAPAPLQQPSAILGIKYFGNI